MTEWDASDYARQSSLQQAMAEEQLRLEAENEALRRERDVLLASLNAERMSDPAPPA